MRDIFACWIAFSVAMTLGSDLVNLTSKFPQSWLLEDFAKSDLRMCRNYHRLNTIDTDPGEIGRDVGQCGPIPIPNLALARPVFEF